MKAQESTTLTFFIITELILVLMAGFAMYKSIKDVGTVYEQRFIARDVALLLDSFSKYPVSFIYGFYRYDTEKAQKAYNEEFSLKQIAKGTAYMSAIGSTSTVTGVLATSPALTPTIGAYISAAINPTYLLIIPAGWLGGKGIVHFFLGEMESVLQDYKLDISNIVTAMHKDGMLGEKYPYLGMEVEEAQLETSPLIRFVYEPRRLRIDTTENRKHYWNPYKRECKQAEPAQEINYYTDETMKPIITDVSQLLQGETITEPTKTEATIIGLVTSPQSGIKIYYLNQEQRACRILNEFTDAYSQQLSGATILPVSKQQLEPTDIKNILNNNGILIQAGPEETKLLLDNQREAANAIRKALL
ncbi:hypothetical protein HY486_02805 [Candidatus Woesearchaeota archaeon]|nr:hypothetical protein [Candidatus Woesearchaeota archaeon]